MTKNQAKLPGMQIVFKIDTFENSHQPLSCQYFFLNFFSAAYSSAPQTALIIEENIMNPDQTASYLGSEKNPL